MKLVVLEMEMVKEMEMEMVMVIQFHMPQGMTTVHHFHTKIYEIL